MNKIKEFNIKEKLSTYLFYASILVFLIAFNFQDSKTGGWYQQIIADIGNRQISDITFTDSLSGYATAQTSTDTNYILKTSNGGDNWTIIHKIYRFLTRVQFINSNVGFVGGSILLKTTNAGINWNEVPTLFDPKPYEIFVFSQDTIWYSDTDPLVGGVFRTTNGGVSWQEFTDGINQPYPDKLYFYNSRIGFASNFQAGDIYKTTNSGLNWSMIGLNLGFGDIVFSDSLTGYMTYDSVRKTTNGGINWIVQQKPKLNVSNPFYQFSVINKDTIWGVGGTILTTLGYRGIVYITTNGGQNWGYQIPDTININIATYIYIKFINKNIGWAYNSYRSGPVPCGGIHTITGGNDTTFYTEIKNITQIAPKNFELKQNYPNPFNNSALIEYYINETGWVKLKIYDMTGRKMATLVNEEQYTGGYGVPVSMELSSGVYFYKMIL